MMDGLDDGEPFLAGEQEAFKACVPQEVDGQGDSYFFPPPLRLSA